MTPFGTGTLNGAVLNGEVLDGGHFVHRPAAVAAVVFASALNATRRVLPGAPVGVAIGAALNARRRVLGNAAAGSMFGAAAIGVRRTRSAGVSHFAIDAAMHPMFGRLRRAPVARTHIVRQTQQLSRVRPAPIAPGSTRSRFVVPRGRQ